MGDATKKNQSHDRFKDKMWQEEGKNRSRKGIDGYRLKKSCAQKGRRGKTVGV